MHSLFVVIGVLLISGCGDPRPHVMDHPPIAPIEAGLFNVADTFGTEAIENEGERDCKALDIEKDFNAVVECMKAEKPRFQEDQRKLLEARYDLSNRPSPTVRMTRGKAIQVGIRVKLPPGVTWEQLAAMTPEEIREKDLFPAGFLPLPHTNHPEGGMLFPHFHIEEVLKQTGRDLNRFDLEFDLPDHVLPEFPAPVFLTTRLDLGDVSKGELITHENFYRLVKDVLNPKDIDGLRLLVSPMPQQQFNMTNDRRSVRASLGVTCLECHANGHTNASFHLVGDIRPQTFRNRIETPSLRGVNVQRLFGSQRALSSIEDFTEFEQRAAYFDGDITLAAKKGVRPLDRPTEVHHMSEMQKLFDFPPAPKLDHSGRLIHAKATQQEIRGEAVFFGRGKCATCHAPPHYSDNLMHDLKYDRFFTQKVIREHTTKPDGPIKTFPLRGIKESPPYFHDGRLMTLEDTVEFFNLILETKLTAAEKSDLVHFLRVL